MNIILKLLITLSFTLTLNASINLDFKSNISVNEFTLSKIKSWEAMVKKAENKKTLKKLKIVNDYFNKLSYKSDLNNWNKSDYWATPVEFLSSGAGDCEDFAIAKFFTLMKLGIKEEQLRLIYTKLAKNNQAHIVLSYSHKPNFVPIILDNVNKKLQLSTKRKDLLDMRNIENKTILEKFQIQATNKLK